MKAAFYYGPGDIKIHEVEIPKARAEGVVLRIRACGICDIMDLQQWLYGPMGGRTPPYRFGHEYAGEIVEIGSKVTGFDVGDRVAMFPVFKPCYQCESCRVGDYWKCINWMKGFAYEGFAEYMELPFVSEDGCVKLPKTLSFNDLALLEPLQFAVGISEKAKAGNTVLVMGQDLLGLGIVAKLKERGAIVFTSDVSERRLKASKDVGADLTINALEEDVSKVIKKETRGKGVDVVILNDPRPDAFIEAMRSVKRAGVIWLTTISSPFRVSPALPPRVDLWISPGSHYVEEPVTFESSLFTMRCVYGTFSKTRVERTLEALKLIQDGKITAEKFVTHRFPLDKISEAFEVASDPHKCIKVEVEM